MAIKKVVKKLKIGILFGGKSAEHEVSIQSAKAIIENLDKQKHDVFLIGISKKGHWQHHQLSSFSEFGKIKTSKTTPLSSLIPQGDGLLIHKENNEYCEHIVDVVFPILHGPFGEDGTVQGTLKLANVPFVGASILGSAIGMDKEIMKRLLKEGGLPVGKFKVYHSYEFKKITFSSAVKEVGLPFVIKPANMGSSVGISKIKNKSNFIKALKEAFKYDNKILLERFIEGREIECSVIGNEHPKASLPGEIVTNKKSHKFYSYKAKYKDEKGAELCVPANLSKQQIKAVQKLAVATFKSLACEGMARVDLFLTPTGEFIINEINTIPGFTPISMFPKLWEASGLSYKKLLNKLIDLAIERFERDKKLQTNYK